MWRLRYHDSLHPEGVWTLHWFRTKDEAEEWAKDADIEPYDLRLIAWPPQKAYTQYGETDEMITALHFMNRWASHLY